VVAVVVTLLIALGAGYAMKRTRPAYLETATVVFSLPRSQTAPNAYFVFAPALITSSEAIIQVLMSPQGRRQISEAGGTAKVDLELVNLYNQEYPEYGVPLATLTAVSPSAAATHRTFMIAARLLNHDLVTRQAHSGVPWRDRITEQVIGDSGAIAQKGSSKRAYAGLAFLTLAGVCMVWGWMGQRLTRQSRPSSAAELAAGYRRSVIPAHRP
jgi:hypothetical protein